MASKKITPLLLAASVLISGFTGVFIQTHPVYAVTSVDELSDVKKNAWAYKALKSLVDKYNVIEGYPDGTFRGNKAPTRYEMAAALDATIKAMGKEIARLGAEKADKEDLAVVAKLQQEFATELTTLQSRANALEARANKIEAKNNEQDNRLAVLEKMKIYGDMTFGGYADIDGNFSDTFSDGISAVGRTRVNFDYSVVDDKGGNLVGPGVVHSRLVAAFGRVAPLESDVLGNGVFRGRYSGVSNMAADSSWFNEGIRTNDLLTVANGNFVTGGANGTIHGSDLRANAYVDSAYYSQVLRHNFSFMPNDESWRSALTIHTGLMPWRDLYFKSPYQGVDYLQFQNTALLNNPAIITDNKAPRVAFDIRQGLGKWSNIHVRTDVNAIDVSDVINGIGFNVEADLGYNLGFLDRYFGTDDVFNVSGNVYGGYYLVKSSGGGLNNLLTVTTGLAAPTAGLTPVNGGVGDMAVGFYAGGNQEIYKGIGAFGSYALNDNGPTSALLSALQDGRGNNIIYNNSLIIGAPLIYGVRQAWTVGGQIPIRALPDFLTFGKRQRDVFGVGYSQIYPNLAVGSPANTPAAAGLPNPGATEKVLEAYYRMQLSDGFALIPSAQLIFDRAGFSPNNTNVVIGLRTSFTF